MREETAEWLNPMWEAAEREGIDVPLSAAMMPAREAETNLSVGMAIEIADRMGVPPKAIDWIHYGQLLRERLGWTDYPEYPPSRDQGRER